MFRRTAIWIAMAAAVVSAGCSSRRGDQLSQDDYPYAGPPSDSYSDARGASNGRAAANRHDAAPRTERDRRSGDTDYYGRWAYAYGRDPSYDYYLASSYGDGGYYDRGYDDDGYGDDEYGYPVTVSYFYDELDPYGDWYDDPRYGWVWYPEATYAGWRPYLNGHWVYTDWGWAWVSEDPWGADPYHYGRWACDASNRWMWVPDDVWAPAWVSWRYGDGWAGWAPLPPEATWDVSFGVRYADDFVAPSRWCFVPATRLTSTRLRSYVAPLPETRRIYTETRDLTRYASVNGRVAERGLRPALIERATGRDIPQYRLTTREGGLRRDMVRGRTLVSPMPVLAREGRGRGGERLTTEMRARRDRFEREMRVRGGRLERGQRMPPGRGGEMQARGRLERGAPVERQRGFDRARMEQDRRDQMRMERDRRDQARVERDRNAREDRALQQQRFESQQRQRGFERQQQQRYEREQQGLRQQQEQRQQQRIERQQQYDRGQSQQRRRDRAEAEGRARAEQQAQRDQARQQAEQARYERQQYRQQAEQERYQRQQYRQQTEQERYQRQQQQQQQDARARQEERRQQAQAQQPQQQQQQQQQPQQRVRQERGNRGGSDQEPSQDQGSDQRGHGRGRGHNR
ncbi:MAG TPA: DUF6600 domain-containing protein [Candidatus Binatia bacterium]|nr:DUF6600 domain-containing protein [Candidatus Binatia bacterium]